VVCRMSRYTPSALRTDAPVRVTINGYTYRNTVAVMGGVFMVGVSEVEGFCRRVPSEYVLRAIAVALLALALVFVLTLTEQARFLNLLFEAFSAFGTVGLTTGITPGLSPASRVILMLTVRRSTRATHTSAGTCRPRAPQQL
jgi:trk system potassium uptake protein